MQCFHCHGWGYAYNSCGTPLNFKWVRGGQTFPQPGNSRVTSASASLRQQQLSERDQYMNPDPLVHLIGETNEVPVCIDSMQCKALIDSGTQMLTITVSFAKQLGLSIEQLGQILNIEATGGGEGSLFGLHRR